MAAGQHVLVQGGAGGVGIHVVQISLHAAVRSGEEMPPGLSAQSVKTATVKDSVWLSVATPPSGWMPW